MDDLKADIYACCCSCFCGTNIIRPQSKITVFYFNIFSNQIYFFILNFQQPYFQSSASHDPPEIITIGCHSNNNNNNSFYLWAPFKTLKDTLQE